MESSVSSESFKSMKLNSSIIKYKDYYTEEYYLKIALTNSNELLIINYNTKILDGEKFMLKLTINILHKASNLFKKFDKIETFYDLLIKLLDNKKYKLSFNSNKILFSIMPNNFINNKKDILLYFMQRSL